MVVTVDGGGHGEWLVKIDSGQDGGLVKTEGWSRQKKVGQDRLWSRQIVVKTDCGQDRLWSRQIVVK
ncbi:hypothetical protein ACN38_g4833, partial [Penicillium nordicum]